MKKVLIIGHFWPYRGGSKRIMGLAKYLTEFGWEPIILTGPLKERPEKKFRFIENDYPCFLGSWVRLFGFSDRVDITDQFQKKINKSSSKVKSFLRFLYWQIGKLFAYPDRDKYWKSFGIKAAEELFKKEKIDAIISVWPATSHLIAQRLKEKYKIPWIADFPDLWSQNYDYRYGRIRKAIDRKLEVKTINSADFLTTISQPLAEKLGILHINKKIFVIPHGFNLKEVNELPAPLTKKFTITYTGQIYTGKQNPLKILTALKELILERKINPDDIEVRFFGPERDWLNKEIKNRGLNIVVAQYGQASRQVSLKKQRESQILLLLNWENENQKGVYTGKIFEYLAARRLILATGGFRGDVVEELLEETKAGVYAIPVDEIKKNLIEFYQEYKQKGKVIFKGNIETINKYSEPEMTRKFADLLNLLV